MSEDQENTPHDEVQRDGLAMLAVLLLSIALIVYVAWNVI